MLEQPQARMLVLEEFQLFAFNSQTTNEGGSYGRYVKLKLFYAFQQNFNYQMSNIFTNVSKCSTPKAQWVRCAVI